MAGIRDDSLSQGMMLLCLGAAAWLLSAQWQLQTSTSAVKLQKSTNPVTVTQAPPLPSVTHTQLLVDLSDRRVYLLQNQNLKATYPVAIGQTGWETPVGQFRVNRMSTAPRWKHPITGQVFAAGPDSPLGMRWIGFWSDGRNQIGFHGTNQEALVGQAVSHGCLRMRNRDIVALYKQVTPGTKVTVQL